MSRPTPRLPSPQLLAPAPWGSAALGAALRCDPLVVAVSGGADSMALLGSLARLRRWLWRGRAGAPLLVAAHYNHGLRPGDADRDEALVRDQCGKWGIRLVAGRGDPAAEAAKTGESLEMAARRLRRAFFLKTADACGAAAIATAHTLDDQLELFFLRLSRGASLRGLSGMRPVSLPDARDAAAPVFLKPFLRLRHASLCEWLRAEGVAWREDATNADPFAADRNRIRHWLVPAVLRACGASFPDTLGRTLDILRDDADALDRLAAPDRPAAPDPSSPAFARRRAAAALYAAAANPEEVTLSAIDAAAATAAAEAVAAGPSPLPPQPRIGIFGGSFDPVHRGHLALARAALARWGLDRVLFVPTALSPFKAGRGTAASAADRVAMLRRAIASEPRFAIDETDIRRGGISYTVELLDALRRDGPPDAQWFFLLGADSLCDLHRWREAGRIVRMCRVVSFGRPGTVIDPDALGFDAVVNARLAGAFSPDLAVDVSSTEARARLAAGDEAPALLEAPVARYALARGLYAAPAGEGSGA